MRRILGLFLMLFIVTFCTCCSNSVQDKRIIGEWTDSSGKYFAFHENGTAEILSPVNVKNYRAENGSLFVSYGSYGEDYYTYEFISALKESDENVSILVLTHKNSNTKYYLTKTSNGTMS